MKSYSSLKEARKSLIRQILVLAAIVLSVIVAARLRTNNRFDTTLILDSEKHDWKPSDLTIEWEGEQIPVRDYRVGLEDEGLSEAEVMYLNLEPEKPGKYEIHVRDPKGNELASDRILVGELHTAISERYGSYTGDEGGFIAAVLLYFGMAMIMLVFFLRLKGHLMYSYEAILAFGVFAFSSFALIVEVPVFIRHFMTPGFYSVWILVNDLGSAGKFFVIFTSPLVFLFSILLIISNIELLRHEPPRFQNLLGLLLGFLLIGGEILYSLEIGSFRAGMLEKYRIFNTVDNVVGIAFTYAECILFSSVVCGLRAAKHVPKPDRDYILILGCGFRKDGTLTPLLRGRVDKAMEFWYGQKEETGKEAVIIPSGGQGKDEPMAEAEAMYRYMISTGFPESAVLLENQSVNTYQNMEFSRKIIEQNAPDPSSVNTAFVTTNYHVFRSGVWAGLAGLTAEGLGSRTKWWFWPNAFVRECVGLLRNRILPEIFFLLVLIAFFGTVTYLAG